VIGTARRARPAPRTGRRTVDPPRSRSSTRRSRGARRASRGSRSRSTARTNALPLFKATLGTETLADELRARRDHPVHKLLRRMFYEGRA
jgi:hypothetical protein